MNIARSFFSQGLRTTDGNRVHPEYLRRTLHVDPDSGSDSASPLRGSFEYPYATVAAALADIRDDEILSLKADNHRYRSHDFRPNKRIHVRTRGGGHAVIDASLALDNADFSAVAGRTNVYQIDVDYSAIGDGSTLTQAFNQTFPMIWQDAPDGDDEHRFACANGQFGYVAGWSMVRSVEDDVLDYVEANAGSYGVVQTDGSAVVTNSTYTALRFYVHLPDSGNPISNGMEYSVGSPSADVFYLRSGGSIENVRITRSAHRNGPQFENCRRWNMRIDNYPVHGCMDNGCEVWYCENRGAGRYTAAAFHGYRNDLQEGTGGGNVYRFCKAYDSAWGFYSHGNGGNGAQAFLVIEDCETHNCQRPVSPSSVQTPIVRRLRAFDLETIVGSINYEDSQFHVVDTPATLDGLFQSPGSMTLTNCYISGGSAASRLFNSVASGRVTMDRTTCTCLNNVIYNTVADALSLTDSIYTGPISVVGAATNSYLSQATLEVDGSHATNAGITGCHSYRRRLDSVIAPTGEWVAVTFNATHNVIFDGTDVCEQKATVHITQEFPLNQILRVEDGLGGHIEFVCTAKLTDNMSNASLRSRTYQMTAVVASNTISTASMEKGQATLSLLSNSAPLYGHRNWQDTKLNLYTDDAAEGDVDQVCVGAWLRLYFEGAIEKIDLGLYRITAIDVTQTQPQLTLDPSPPVYVSEDYTYRYYHQYMGAGGGGDWNLKMPQPRVEVRVADTWVRFNETTATSPSATEYTSEGRTTTRAADPWQGITAWVLPAVTGADMTDDWTIDATVWINDAQPEWVRGERNMRRLIDGHYLRTAGVGCDL